MKKAFCLLILLICVGCQNINPKQSENDDLTNEEKAIIETFADVDTLLALDNGYFWKTDIYGPIILIDPETRIFYSNENNLAEDFKQISSLYTDTLPNEINIANTAFIWDDKMWSMVILPLPTDKTSQNNLLIHELFHRIQPEIGFGNLQELNNGHLDSYEGRLLLKLELEALEEALNSNENDERLTHIRNALIFRNKRYVNPEIKNAENSLELNEGIAEYTAIMLSSRNEEEMKLHLSQSKDEFYTNPTFIRSFAYQTIPYYGCLLSFENPNWHKAIDKNTNLSDYFSKAFRIKIERNQSIEKIAKLNNYQYLEIDKVEKEREKARIAKIAALKNKFVTEHTFELAFQNMNISFDPRNITPLENFGTVYPNLRVTDDWGILTVENEALLVSDWSKVLLTIPSEINDSIIIGDGWKLELNPKWRVEKKGDKYQLEKI